MTGRILSAKEIEEGRLALEVIRSRCIQHEFDAYGLINRVEGLEHTLLAYQAVVEAARTLEQAWKTEQETSMDDYRFDQTVRGLWDALASLPQDEARAEVTGVAVPPAGRGEE